MKSFVEYINESQKTVNEGNIEVDVMAMDDYGNVSDEVWQTFTLPDAKWFVYKDYYNSGDWHFAALGDMLGAISTQPEDFEDFNPKKDILFSGNDYKDVLAKMFNKIMKIDLTKFNTKAEAVDAILAKYKDLSEDDFYDEYEPNYTTVDGIKDSIDVLLDYYYGILDCDSEYQSYKDWLDGYA